jgi:hypothetical protein
MTHPIRLAAGLLAVLLLAATVHPAPAQEVLAPPNEELTALDARVAGFLEAVAGGQAQAAYSDLLSGSPLLEQEKALAELIDQTTKLSGNGKYGAYRSHERIGLKTVGRDLVLLRYLYKCENYPVVWYFTFYRTSSAGAPTAPSWRAIAVRFDADLDLLQYAE